MLLNAFVKTLCPYRPPLKKMGRIMRILTLFLFAACLQLSARMEAQGISLSLNNVVLSTAFNEIQQQTSYRFVFTNEQIESAAKVSISIQHGSIEKVLELCFKDQPLTYSIEDKYIIVKVKEKKVLIARVIENEVRGKVMNEKAEPVTGATVSLKGSNNATATDSKGEFVLANIIAGSVIVVSSIGFEPQEIIIGNNRYLAIHLQTSVSTLDEMVIKGYYNTSKKLNTGSVARVSGEEINKQPVNNVLAALEGRMPGVYIQQNTGVPGGSFNIQIRGQNSLRNSTTDNGNLPLYVIDGVPFTASSLTSSLSNNNLSGGNPLSNLNPADIESVEVLKDADGTSIYGSRGANGVVLITTKKGGSGKTTINLDAFHGIGQVSRTMKLLNTRQYLEMRHEAFRNDGALPGTGAYDVNGVWDTTRSTDWQKLLIGGKAHITSAQLSLNGGDANTQFLFGMGYNRETSVYPGDFVDARISAHLHLHHSSVNQKLQFNLSLNYQNDDNRLPNIDLSSPAQSLAPDAPPVYKDNGQLNWQNSTWTNPFASLLKKYKANSDNLLANGLISYEIIPGLRIKTSIGYTSLQVKELLTSPLSSINPAFVSAGTTASSNFSDGSIHTLIAEPQLEYQKNIDKGRLSVLVGSTLQENIQQGQTLSATGYVSDALLENIRAASAVTVVSNNYTQYRYNALFGRINYVWKEKYIVNITGRRDGSSRFADGHQFGNFGALGAAWVFSEEKYTREKLHWLSYGKMRASIGTTGSDQIPDYGYLNTYSLTSYPYNGSPGLLLTRLYNSDYSWEKNKKIELGLELGFLHNKIMFYTNWYRNRSSNQLVGYSLPVITGQSSIQFNFPAVVENKGWEFELNCRPLTTTHFKWSTGFNISFPQNKLVDYPGLASSPYANTFVVGQPLSIKKNYHYTGVDAKTGLYTFQDFDNNGSITFPNDLSALKKITQQYYGGFQNSFSFQNFQLSFFLQFVKQTGYNYQQYFSLTGSANNQPIYALNRWQNAGDAAINQQYSQNFGSAAAANFFKNQSSDNTIQDASFMRLKNLSLSYDLPDKCLKKLHMRLLRIYIRGQNLVTITNYQGSDPENQNPQKLPALRVLSAGISFSL